MSSQLAQLQDATIKQHCKTLRMPMMASQFRRLGNKASLLPAVSASCAMDGLSPKSAKMRSLINFEISSIGALMSTPRTRI